MDAFSQFEQVLDAMVCMGALYFLSYSSLFLFYLFLLLPLAFIFEEEEACSSDLQLSASMMLMQQLLTPHQAQGAGDALLQAEIPPNLQRLLNILLLLAVVHFLIQVAIYFSCLFLILPMSFVISNVISGANTIMAVTSHENLRTALHLGQGAGERAEERVLLPYLLGVEDLVISMAVVYFLVRAGLVFCNLIFILPLIFFLTEST